MGMGRDHRRRRRKRGSSGPEKFNSRMAIS